jgi:hypothetical protein
MVIQFNRNDEYGESLIEIYHSWWGVRKAACLSNEILSDFGICSFIENRPIFISFLYPILGCKTALWGFQAASPDATKEEKHIALKESATAASEIAKRMGFTLLMSYPGHAGLCEKLVENGFIKSEPATQILRRVSDGC